MATYLYVEGHYKAKLMHLYEFDNTMRTARYRMWTLWNPQLFWSLGAFLPSSFACIFFRIDSVQTDCCFFFLVPIAITTAIHQKKLKLCQPIGFPTKKSLNEVWADFCSQL